MMKFSWKNCLEILALQMSEEEYSMWISPLEVVFKDDHVMVLAANEIVLRGVQTKFKTLLENAIVDESGFDIEIRYGLGTESEYEDHQGTLGYVP